VAVEPEHGACVIARIEPGETDRLSGLPVSRRARRWVFVDEVRKIEPPP
jgi:hypothetical protein